MSDFDVIVIAIGAGHNRLVAGLRTRVFERVVFSLLDLERNVPNLRGGDSVAGSRHLRQNSLWRPSPGWSTYRMPLENLWMAGAATWPGASANAVSGYLAAPSIMSSAPAGRSPALNGTRGSKRNGRPFSVWTSHEHWAKERGTREQLKG